MGFFSYVLLGGLATYGIHKIRQANEEEQREIEAKRRQEAKRKSCVYAFDEGLSENEFRSIVYSCAKKIKRIEKVVVDKLEIFCVVSSQSGITQWSFLLDYNDYGKLSGKCYSKSENKDSNIPERLNDLIYEKIQPYIEIAHCEEQTENEIKTVPEQKRVKEKKCKKWVFAVILAFLISILSFAWYYEYQKLIPIGYSDSMLEGLEYVTVIEKLEAEGFTNVSTKEISDLPISREDQTNIVTKVNVGKSSTFSSSKKYPYNLPITVEYHTVQLHKPTFTSKEAKGMNYLDVVNGFKSDGYTNIKIIPEYDIVMGWIAKDGEVKSIKINGEEKYDEYSTFRPDAEIIITYHMFRSNKPKE